MPSSRLIPAERARAEEPRHVLRGDRGELVDHHQAPRRALLQCGDHRLQVLHDRGPHHLREQRSAVGLEAEVDHRPLAHSLQQVETLSARRGGVEARTDVGLDQDRQAVAHPRQVAALPGGERVQVGVYRPPLLRLQVSREQLQPRGVERLHEARKAHLAPRGPQRADRVPEVALRLALVVGLGEALPRERLVGDLGLRAAGVRVVHRRRPRAPTR